MMDQFPLKEIAVPVLKVKLQVEPPIPGCIPPAWLLNDHYNENAVHKDVLTRPSPQLKIYQEAWQKGELIYVTMRAEESNELVGYATLFLRPHPHYGVPVAVDDLHYLVPHRRSLGLGKMLIEFAEREAAARGAKIICMRDKAGQEHAPMWDKMGYRLTDLVYTKDLRDVAVD